MAERPFNESCAVTGLGEVDGLETVLRCHSLIPLVVIADAVLERVPNRRERRRYMINIPGLGVRSEAALQPNGLPDSEVMRRNIAHDRTANALHRRCSGHGSLDPFESAIEVCRVEGHHLLPRTFRNDHRQMDDCADTPRVKPGDAVD